MLIYFIGFMGSGKTTWGQKIAKELDLEFIDMDKMIEDRAGKSVPEIFEQDGEDHFRSMEAECLRDLSSKDNALVATGGGAPCHSDNMDVMKKSGMTVYLSLPPGALVDRLRNAKDDRPLIKNLEDEDLMDHVRLKLDERDPYYTQADMVVEPIKTNWKEVALKIKLAKGGQTR